MYDLYTYNLDCQVRLIQAWKPRTGFIRAEIIPLKAYRFFSGAFGSYVTAASNSESGSFRL
jgi:hypothetical protein